MSITAVSSREFNQDVSKVKRAAANGPVFITDRGQAAHVFLTVEEYQRITEKEKSIVEALAMPEAAEINFDPAPLKGDLYRPADLS